MAKRRLLPLAVFILLVLFVIIVITGNFSIPSVMDIYNCREMFSRYNVDAGAARQNVPPKWNLKVNSEGEALMLVMVQKCEKMVLDGVFDVGPVGMSHIWIELEGPKEFVTPLPGTSGSLPTRYWHILPHQLDNRLARILFGLVGVDAQYAKSISLGDTLQGARPGDVIETAAAEEGYRWKETIELYPEEDIVTGSQRFYREYGARDSEAVAKCESHFLGDSEVYLEASATSTIGRLGFGTNLEGISNPVLVSNCHVNYKVNFFDKE